MADTKREIERKFEFPEKASKAARRALPDLTGTAAVAAVRDEGTVDLDAVYYDTPDQRLAADGLTLRRRTGGGGGRWAPHTPLSPRRPYGGLVSLYNPRSPPPPTPFFPLVH
ncbi:CYTH domain-containing protein, partial [Streptomyces goshikiensis]|uniref:CYTH domain-containing protein n=1 Tax=Streptomyces goshikiensis TaxID=1942 RepID=UPI0036466D9D